MNKRIRQNRLFRLSFNLTMFLSSIILFSSCNDDDLTSESFMIGHELVESTTEIVYFDTLSVELSTVILDSVRTSNTNRLLVGEYSDGDFGMIQSKSFFALSPSDGAFIEDDIYDSLTLVLNYDGYSYGDTLVEQTIKVYALNENIELNDNGYLYSTSDFSYSKTLLGQLTYAPNPTDDFIEIRLSDDLGTEFFTKLVRGDDEFVNSTSFLDYFPGLVVEAESDGNSAIIGFSAVDSNLHMSLYYHRTGFEMEEIEFKMALYDPSYQFNQVSVDRSGTVLESWEEQRESIPSSLTNNQVYVQGITGILTRIEFPSIDMFIELGEKASLIKAELFFEPIKNTYDEIEIPLNTVLYQTDGRNRTFDPIYDEDGSNIQLGLTYIDYLYHENTSISFDLSNYFRYDFIDNYYDPDYGFLLGLSESVFYESFDRIILGGLEHPEHMPKLKVYYMLYN